MPFVVNYIVIFFVAVGIGNPYQLNVIISSCGFLGALLSPFFLEFGGRRLAMLCGYGGMATCLLISGATASGLGIKMESAQHVLISFLCIWFFIFSMCISPSAWLLQAEIHSVRLRTYGTSVAVFMANLFNFGTSFWTPYMINPAAGNWGTNTAYFYLGTNIVAFLLAFAFLPETARLSLEQLDDYFESGRKAWNTSITRNKKIARGEIYDIPPITHHLGETKREPIVQQQEIA